jgi:hypothetical protein
MMPISTLLSSHACPVRFGLLGRIALGHREFWFSGMFSNGFVIGSLRARPN